MNSFIGPLWRSIFSASGLAALLCLLTLGCGGSTSGTGGIKFSGIVQDDAGKTLPGVTVAIAGYPETTVTDANGSFEIYVEEDADATYELSFTSDSVAASVTIADVPPETTEIDAIYTVSPSSNTAVPSDVSVVSHTDEPKGNSASSGTTPTPVATQVPDNGTTPAPTATAGITVTPLPNPGSSPESTPTATPAGPPIVTIITPTPNPTPPLNLDDSSEDSDDEHSNGTSPTPKPTDEDEEELEDSVSSTPTPTITPETDSSEQTEDEPEQQTGKQTETGIISLLTAKLIEVNSVQFKINKETEWKDLEDEDTGSSEFSPGDRATVKGEFSNGVLFAHEIRKR